MTERELKREYAALMSKVCAFSVERILERIFNENPTMVGIDYETVENLEDKLADIDRTVRMIAEQLNIKMAS